jgi:hypothetical protein
MYLFLSMLYLLGLFLVPVAVFAAEENPTPVTGTPINLNVPIAGENVVTDEQPGGFLADYLGLVFTWAHGIIGSIAILMIIVAGFQMMMAQGSSDMVTAAKERLLNAIFGLVLVILSAVILRTINPVFFT